LFNSLIISNLIGIKAGAPPVETLAKLKMSTKTTTPTNGKAETPNATTSTAKIAPITTEVKKDTKPADDLPPVEDRILKINQLFGLVEKHESLLELRKRLKSFKVSTDGTGDSLQLRDSKGNSFNTSNSACIADVLNVLKATIDKKIAEVESQIHF